MTCGVPISMLCLEYDPECVDQIVLRLWYQDYQFHSLKLKKYQGLSSTK